MQNKDSHLHQIDNDLDEMFQNNKKMKLPKKGDYRMRAHINPLGDTPFPYPLNPDYFDLRKHYPLNENDYDSEKLYLNTENYPLDYEQKVDDKFNGKKGKKIDFIDVGCGYGGLLFALSKNFPDNLSLGMEIRGKLVDYVGQKIQASRINTNNTEFNNISVLRTNSMRHITNYFRKGSLKKIFICFADPHFKRKNFRRRIINPTFIAEYSYLLENGGKLYAITDVKDLHDWHETHLQDFPLFNRIPDEEALQDKCVQLIFNETEEGQKVSRNKGDKYVCVYQKKNN